MAAAAWADARTLADLGALTADWLEGCLDGEHPNGYDRPDEETEPLVPPLAAACRAGFVTTNSQPGSVTTVNGKRVAQWAWVTGYVAETRTWLRLAEEVARYGLLAWVCSTDERTSREPVAVTLVDGEPLDADGYGYCVLGDSLPAEQVAVEWEGCHPEAITAAVGSWQVTVVDPEVGRNDVLWMVLNSLELNCIAPT